MSKGVYFNRQRIKLYFTLYRPVYIHIHLTLRTGFSCVAFMCCPFSVSIMKWVSTKAYRDCCGCLWEESPVILLTGVTARTRWTWLVSRSWLSHLLLENQLFFFTCVFLVLHRGPFFKWNLLLGKRSTSHQLCTDVSGAFEDTSFASLAGLVSESTLKAVKEMSFEHMTEIQHKSIRPLLEGRWVLSFEIKTHFKMVRKKQYYEL